MGEIVSLTDLEIDADTRYISGEGVQQRDYSDASGHVEVVFRGQSDRLIELIGDAAQTGGHVLGAVAWLTDKRVLDALSRVSAAIVVQKEDFLRPDGPGYREADLRRMYRAIQCNLDRYSLPGIASELSVCYDPSVAGVRCVGNHNRERKPSWPRMHNKFLVFCREVRQENDHPTLDPYKVWTGSCNLSYTATCSWENAVIIDDKCIANAFAYEWAQIFAFSEPLNWEDEWCAPEYRLGT